MLPYAAFARRVPMLWACWSPCPRSPLRDSRHAAYAATQPHLVGFGAILLTFLAEAKVPGGRVHG